MSVRPSSVIHQSIYPGIHPSSILPSIHSPIITIQPVPVLLLSIPTTLSSSDWRFSIAACYVTIKRTVTSPAPSGWVVWSSSLSDSFFPTSCRPFTPETPSTQSVSSQCACTGVCAKSTSAASTTAWWRKWTANPASQSGFRRRTLKSWSSAASRPQTPGFKCCSRFSS